MPSQKTQDLINDLKAAGLDTSGIENQMRLSPLVDRSVDSVLGGGILRQSEYTRYMNDLQKKELQLNQQVNQLASLHDARDSGVNLPKDTLDVIDQMERALIATGEFDEASIKALSHKAKNATVNINPQQQQQPVIQPNNNNDLNQNHTQNFDPSKFVDPQTMRTELANIAYGSIATNMAIQAELEDVRSLGIKVGRQELAKFQENLRNGYERGKGLQDIVEETFEVSKVRQVKEQEFIEKRINEEADKRTAEALKAAGVPQVKKFNNLTRHPILDRKRNINGNVPSPEGNSKTDSSSVETTAEELNAGNKLPVNKYGDPELFRGRRTREGRLQNATLLHDKVMEHLADDITFVD